jgi:hypothetical protein
MLTDAELEALAQRHLEGPPGRPVVAVGVAIFEDPPGICFVARLELTPEERAMRPDTRPGLVGASPFFIDRRTGAILHYFELRPDDTLRRLMTEALGGWTDAD